MSTSKSIMLQGTADPFEVFVSQWLRMKGYLVQTPVNYRRKGGKAVKGRFWSDIDIVGTKGREFVIVECKEWISSSKQDAIEEIEEKFRNAADFFDGIGLTKGKNVRFIFARIESEPKFEKLLNSLSIKLGKSVECVDFRQLVKEMIEEICPFIDSTHIGKFGEPISWLLSRLIYYELIKTEATTT